MEYIKIKKDKTGRGFEETTSNEMEGLSALLQDSMYCTSLDELCIIEEYKRDRLEFHTDSFYLKSIGKNLVEVCGFDYENDDDDKYKITLPKDALWEFAALYKTAEDKDWKTLKIGFDGKQFKLWLDGKEYNPDSNRLS